jgi:S-adenosylmethionine-diacylglycerol 3-amino-3-carboxypropyl transferase
MEAQRRAQVNGARGYTSMSELAATPDNWTADAAQLPLAFAQVREDPRLDLELVNAPDSTVAMIASGGETAACMAFPGVRRLFLVDLNPAQLALTRLKLRLASGSPAVESMRLLGHLPLPAEDRERLLLTHLDALDMERGVFGSMSFVAVHGPDRAGRYEFVFAKLAETLAPHRAVLQRLLDMSDPAEQRKLLETQEAFVAALDEAFERVMSLPNLVHLFGNEATQNPQRPFSRHFAERTRNVLDQLPANSNPFLWQMLAGRFPPEHPYDWLSSRQTTQRNPDQEQIFLHGKMRDVLDSLSANSCDVVHLSNILDWLRPEQALATLHSAMRVLKPGGITIVRQLNSCLDVAGLPSGFQWDVARGKRLLRSDRSFFYRAIHIGRKP